MNAAGPPCIYLADTLAGRHPALVAALQEALTTAGVQTGFLPGTRDIWARDYMPVPTASQKLVQFRYAPDYLSAKGWKSTINDGYAVAQSLGLTCQRSPLVVDGGNVVLGFGRALMTDKVLRENPAIPPVQLLALLADSLEVSTINLIPSHPDDFTGHADGMVHLLDERTVLVNDYGREPKYQTRLRAALRRAGFEEVTLPYNPYQNSDDDSAVGIYINFLRVNSSLLVPIYELPEDDKVMRQLTGLFPGHTIVPINGRSLAAKGGVFHCFTWGANES